MPPRTKTIPAIPTSGETVAMEANLVIAQKATPQGGVNRLVPGAEVDITCANVMYPGSIIRYVSGAYIEFDSRQGYTVLPWGAIRAITFPA